MTYRINEFIKKLATTKTGKTLFNPYNEFTKNLDDKTSPGIRQQNLRLYLNAHKKLQTKHLWVYLAPVYRESRKTGVPLTSRSNYDLVEDILNTKTHFEKTNKARKSSNNATLSTTLWDVANDLNINPLIWPLIPFYAHNKGKPTSKRKHTKEEILKYSDFITEIISIYKPETIISIGKSTKNHLDDLQIKSKYIKHPRKGKKAFKSAIQRTLK